jgi:hypothetical protein
MSARGLTTAAGRGTFSSLAPNGGAGKENINMDAFSLASRLYERGVDLEHPDSWTQTARCCIDAARAFAAECDDHRDHGRPVRDSQCGRCAHWGFAVDEQEWHCARIDTDLKTPFDLMLSCALTESGLHPGFDPWEIINAMMLIAAKRGECPGFSVKSAVKTSGQGREVLP